MVIFTTKSANSLTFKEFCAIIKQNLIGGLDVMTKKYVENEELVNPSRYTQNKIESWDFSLYSCFPHMIATVTEYVIRYKHKGGIQDLEKARIWLHKAKDSYKYLALCTPKLSVSEYRELAPKVDEENFSDLSVEQLGILRTAQTLTMSLDNEHIFKECIAIIDKYLELLIDMEKAGS
jgi:hypothetical protein